MFFQNYAKPGKGVNKRDPNQPRIKTFFEILPRKLWNLCKLNWLYLITAIPFFLVTMFIAGIFSSPIINSITDFSNDVDLTMLAVFDLFVRFAVSMCFLIFWGLGPCTAGFTFITRNYGKEEHCWLFSDYFEKFRQNFKQSILLWIIDLVVFYLLAVAFMFYHRNSMFLLTILVASVTVVYTMMHMYIYQMMISYKLSFIDIIKNSLLLTFIKAPQNVLLLFVVLAMNIGIPYLIYSLFHNVISILVIVLLEACMLPALSSFITNFFVYTTLEMYVNGDNRAEEKTEQTVEI
ncbi:MAG: DUF624 domain-containing protein [Ruminococcaceae bacterium]|nr:DUF624 domain-containing protein [Oscillospiraceae bacterium]